MVTLRPIKASGWLNSGLTDEEKAALIVAGMVPINDVFFDLWDDESKIKLLYGGYGSGKSDYEATWLVNECRKPGYFKLFFGRKVEDKVRESCHSKLVSIIERQKLEHEFSYSKQPNGSMLIIHKATGNSMHPFGAASPDDMKSVDDPTHIWMEEADQFTDKDLQVLLSRLRTPRAKHHLILTFNTVSVLPGHWILRYFFPEECPDSEDNAGIEELKRALAAVKTKKVFCNYTDNYFQDQEEYYNTLVIASGGDQVLLKAIASGAWGATRTGQEFYPQFSNVPITDTGYIPELPLHISFDDNVNPYLPCGIFQLYGKRLVLIDEIAGRPPNNRISKVTAEIIRRYPNHTAGMFIYGDATASKDDTKLEDGYDFFRLITDALKQYHPKKRVSKSNPSVVMRGNFINTVFDMHFDGCEFEVNKKCSNTINDFSRVQTDAEGKKHKAMITDPVSKVRYQLYGHFTDLTDYIMCWVWQTSFETYQRGGKIPKPKFGKPAVSKQSY